MLGAVGPDLYQTCQDKGFWYRVFHPECTGTGTDTQISSTIVNTAPSAPLTQGAMTVNGVWTPDYAMQRTQDNVQTENDMLVAAAQARLEDEANPCSGSMYALIHPGECLNVPQLPSIDPTWLYVGAGVLAYAMLR